MVGRVATLLVTLLLAWTTSSHTADAQSLAGTLLATPSTSPFAAPLLCLNGGVLLRTPNAANPQLVDVQCACVNGWSGQSVRKTKHASHRLASDRCVGWGGFESIVAPHSRLDLAVRPLTIRSLYVRLVCMLAKQTISV